MKYTYRPRGVCSRQIEFEIEDNKVKNLKFIGGCAGNTLGIAHLIEGMDVDEAIKRTENIHCGMRGTSCPDQLSRALKEAVGK